MSKSKVFEIYAKIKFEIRITKKKLYVDIVNPDGEKRIYCYIEYNDKYLSQDKKPYYIVTKPHSSWTKWPDTLEDAVKIIENDLGVLIPNEAVDIFISNLMIRKLK